MNLSEIVGMEVVRESVKLFFLKLHLRVIRTVRTVISGMCENPIRVRL